MSVRPRPGAAAKRTQAHVFAALGEETRLSLVARLSGGARQSITELAKGSRLTRQAISKHLRMLESAGLVRSCRAGREQLFEFRPEAIVDTQKYLAGVALQWDQALGRFKRLVEG
jgi:DNA-binding transcriptional ArsR family regulator